MSTPPEETLERPPAALPTRAGGAAITGLSLRGVSRAFPGVQALDAVDLAVRPGEIHGLVGENGAGKSTLMAIASGALAPDAGTVCIGGVELDAGRPSAARDLGLAIVRQHPLLMDDLSVGENLVLGLAPEHRPRSLRRLDAWARERLHAWRPDCGIAPGDRVGSLAPDQRFAVAIAKALAQEPRVLILDEPTEHLAPADVEVLFQRVHALAQGGTAIVYISHRIREVQRLAVTITVLRDGVSRGTFDAAGLTEERIVELIVGRPIDALFPDKAPARAAAAGVSVLELRRFGGEGFAPLDLTVRAGEIVGLAGIEGNGQREFLRALAGLAGAHGEMRVGGQAARVGSAHPSARPGVAYLPSDRHREGMLAESSVRENVVLRGLRAVSSGGLLRGAEERERAVDAVRRFAIKTPSIETPIGSLSGGNQQKTVLASILGGRPRLLLADEPTQGVDVGARSEIYQLLRAYVDDGQALVVLASDALELEGLCDRVLIFSRGHVAAELEGDEVVERRITSEVLTATTTRDHARTVGGPLRRWLAGDQAPPLLVALAIVLLGVYAASANEFFLTDRNLTGVLLLTATLALVAIGQQLTLLVGGIDLSVGPLMGLVVVVESFFLTETAAGGMHALGWALLPLVALAAGALNWSLVEYAKLQPMVATLATYMGFQGVSLILRPTPDGLIAGDVITAVTWTFGIFPVAFLVAAGVAVAFQAAIVWTRPGIHLRGLGSNAEAVRVSGVDPRRVRLLAYAGCSLLAGVAAIPLMAQVGSGDPAAGIDYTLMSVAAAVIGGASIFGGRGSIVGCLLGALLIQEIASVTTFLQLSAAWQSYLLGGMILLAVSLYSLARRAVTGR